MDPSGINEPYYRVQNQSSCDESIEGDAPSRDITDASNTCQCLCRAKTHERNTWILGTVAIFALLLSLASVAMVTMQWAMLTDTDVKTPTTCVCPTLDLDRNVDDGMDPIQVPSDPSASESDGVDLFTEYMSSPEDIIDVDCPTCRVRRDGQRRASGRRQRTRHRKCPRACHVNRSENRSSITAIHFQGYPPGVYHLGQADGVYVWWRPATWYNHMTGFHYNHSSGHVTVRKTGLYYIYSQMVHSETNGQKYAIIINGAEFLKCVQSVSPGHHSATYESTCYTGGATFLHTHDRIWIKGIHTSGHVTIKPESTFWGLIRLGSRGV